MLWFMLLFKIHVVVHIVHVFMWFMVVRYVEDKQSLAFFLVGNGRLFQVSALFMQHTRTIVPTIWP